MTVVTDSHTASADGSTIPCIRSLIVADGVYSGGLRADASDWPRWHPVSATVAIRSTAAPTAFAHGRHMITPMAGMRGRPSCESDTTDQRIAILARELDIEHQHRRIELRHGFEAVCGGLLALDNGPGLAEQRLHQSARVGIVFHD